MPIESKPLAISLIKLNPLLFFLCAVPAAFTGCTTSKQAQQVSASLIVASTKAADQISKLQKVSEAQGAALSQSDDQLRGACSTLEATVKKLATAQVNGICLKEISQIQKAEIDQLENLFALRQQVNGEIDQAINQNQTAGQDLVNSLRDQANASKTAYLNYTNDFKLKAAWQSANLVYDAAVLSLNTDELGKRISLEQSLDSQFVEASKKFDSLAQEATNKVSQLCQKAIEKIQGLPDPAFPVPPVTPLPADAYQGLIDYANAVKMAGTSLQNYFVAWSFGKGSYFDDFFKSLSSGILGGVVNPSSLSNFSVSTFVSSAKDAINPILDDMKSDLGDAKETAKKEGSDLLTQISSQIQKKLTDTLSPAKPATAAKP